jgi:hypothetical protein
MNPPSMTLDESKDSSYIHHGHKSQAFIYSPLDTPQGPGGVILFRVMPAEPSIKRAVAFFDGQNLFYHAKAAFGYGCE